MIAFLWAKVSKWLALAGAFIVAIGTALAFGFLKGEKTGAARGDADAAQTKAQAAEQQAALAASDQQAQAQAVQAATEASNAVNSLPDAGDVAPDVAPPDSAAGKLHDAGWVQPGSDSTGKP